jgi:hypothetical protein
LVTVLPVLQQILRRREERPMSKALHDRIIAHARDLISVEHRWTQNAKAITRAHERIDPHHPRAKRFCAVGALERAAFDLTGDVAAAALLARTACEYLCPTAKDAIYELEQINDRLGHAAALWTFDKFLQGAHPEPGRRMGAQVATKQKLT